MIDFEKVEKYINELDFILKGLNEVEKDFILSQYLSFRQKNKDKQKGKDVMNSLIGSMSLNDIYNQFGRDKDD